jgi:hypothetical protein
MSPHCITDQYQVQYYGLSGDVGSHDYLYPRKTTLSIFPIPIKEA